MTMPQIQSRRQYTNQPIVQARGVNIAPAPLASSCLIRRGALVRGNPDPLPAGVYAGVALDGNDLLAPFGLGHLT